MELQNSYEFLLENSRIDINEIINMAVYGIEDKIVEWKSDLNKFYARKS